MDLPRRISQLVQERPGNTGAGVGSEWRFCRRIADLIPVDPAAAILWAVGPRDTVGQVIRRLLHDIR